MKASIPTTRSDESFTTASTLKKRNHSPRGIAVCGILFLLALVISSLSVEADSSSAAARNSNQETAPDQITIMQSTPVESASILKLMIPLMSPQDPTPVTLATFAADCTTPKSVFNVRDADLTVCAKVTGGEAGWIVVWSNSAFEAKQQSPIGTGESTFLLSTTSSLGDWRVIAYEPLGGLVYGLTTFTVIDEDNPTADLAVVKEAAASAVAAGIQAVFTVQVTNFGPNDVAMVQVADSVPANTTFSSFALVTGQAGVNCINPSAGASSGLTTCTIPSLARGETAIFLGAYDVNIGVAAGTTIFNTAQVSSSTTDPRNLNDSSTAEIQVSGAAAETCILDCPANVVVTADTTFNGQAGAFVTFAAATVNGNCGAVTNSPASGSFFPVGAHSIVSTSEIGGASCTFTVTVLDTNPPTITCPADITLTAAEGETEATLPMGPGNPTISASGGGTVTGVRSDAAQLTDPYPIGTTGILWTVTDAGGRTASCTQTITIVAFGDRDPVTISCPAAVNVTAPAGACEATIPAATIGNPTTNPVDNVTVSPRRSDDRPLSDPFPAGITTITWTATDDLNGNVASCVQNVTVIPAGGSDTTPPTLHVPANVTATTTSCTATLDDELGVATAEDEGNCSNSSVSITRTGVPASFIFPTGTTTILYTATDAAGNTTTGLQLVTVLEDPAMPPTITAPTDVSVMTGPGATSCGAFVSDATLGSALASDNCPGVTVTRTGVPDGNIFPVGNTTVTYTATDRSGNTATDTQVVTVVDNTEPLISCPLPISLEPTCPSGAIANWTPPVGTDNCPGATTDRTAGPAPGSVFPIGNTTVTYIVNDAHGNSASCSFTVTVLTPQAVIQNMIDVVNGIPGLSGQQRQGLRSKLEAALDALNDDKKNVACNKLGDFISQVQGYINNGTLTSAQGQSLISSANNVRNTIGCTNLGCS